MNDKKMIPVSELHEILVAFNLNLSITFRLPMYETEIQEYVTKFIDNLNSGVNMDENIPMVKPAMSCGYKECKCEYCYGLVDDHGKDMIEPSHYVGIGGMEAIDVIDAFKLNNNLANVVKYVLRCDNKGMRKTDLKKAMWYLRREIDKDE